MPFGALINPLDGGPTVTNGQIAGGVLYGLNGQTITGNSSGAWAVAANGTSQSITLTPSGTGKVLITANGQTASFPGLTVDNATAGAGPSTLLYLTCSASTSANCLLYTSPSPRDA